MDFSGRLPKQGDTVSFIRPIVEWPDPRLRQVCEPIHDAQFNSEELYEQAGQMIHALWKANAIGIAANQLGYDNAMIVVLPYPAKGERKRGYPIVMCNPTIEAKGQLMQTMPEGCLSFPGQRAIRRRNRHIAVLYRTIDGAVVTMAAKDLLSQCIQHEVDHLNGRVFIEAYNDAPL